VLGKRPHTTAEEVENLLAARLARQEILTREDPPLTYLVMDEAVLHRPVAVPDVMAAQLEHLAGLAGWPDISIQVVPYSAGGHIGLLGAFTIAEMADMSAMVFLENAADGQTQDERRFQLSDRSQRALPQSQPNSAPSSRIKGSAGAARQTNDSRATTSSCPRRMTVISLRSPSTPQYSPTPASR